MTSTGNPNRFLALQWQRAAAVAAGLDDSSDRPGLAAIITVAACRTFYADADGTHCYPSQRTLAKTGGLHHRSVAAVDSWLVEAGFMAFVMKRKDGQNSYRLTFPTLESGDDEMRSEHSHRVHTDAPRVPADAVSRLPRVSRDDYLPSVVVLHDADVGSDKSLPPPPPPSTSIQVARFEFVLRALDDDLNDIFPDTDDDSDDDSDDEGDDLWAAREVAFDRCTRPFVQFCQTYPSGVPGEYAGAEQILAHVAALDTRRQREHLDHLLRVDRQCRQRLAEFTTTNPAKKETNT